MIKILKKISDLDLGFTTFLIGYMLSLKTTDTIDIVLMAIGTILQFIRVIFMFGEYKEKKSDN